MRFCDRDPLIRIKGARPVKEEQERRTTTKLIGQAPRLGTGLSHETKRARAKGARGKKRMRERKEPTSFSRLPESCFQLDVTPSTRLAASVTSAVRCRKGQIYLPFRLSGWILHIVCNLEFRQLEPSTERFPPVASELQQDIKGCRS